MLGESVYLLRRIYPNGTRIFSYHGGLAFALRQAQAAMHEDQYRASAATVTKVFRAVDGSLWRAAG